MKLPLVGTLLLAAGLLAAPAMATSLDLTGATTSGTINGGFFIRTDAASTGTGVIDSFVRLSSNNDVEQGYNADARPVMSDVNTSPTFTRDILLSDVPIVVNPSGAAAGSYYEFLLDINQTKSNPFLSLDKLQIYTRATPLASVGGPTPPDATLLAGLTSTSTLRYNMDGAPAGDSEVLMDYSLNSGSGSGDLFVYIPVGDFGLTTDYVYLYSQFGGKGVVGDVSYTNNDGYEEWAVQKGAAPSVPDGGATVALIGLSLLGIAGLRRRLASK